MEALVYQGADFDIRDEREDDMPSCVHYAAKHGYCAVIRWLAENGADIDDQNLDFRTPLRECFLCFFCDKSMVDLCLCVCACMLLNIRDN